ncbi:hypothetical protein [Pseudanabaena minima]|uniref:hypothetical protein n=1 Tax=Pseudanabaena minima TaxID=890415 RepID=UPI003DAA2BC1
MPISNPIVNLITNPPPLPVVLVQSTDPLVVPERDRVFWLNTTTNKLWVAIATNSPSDWRAIASDQAGAIDVATILNKILVQDGQVLTTDDHVIFQD